MLRYPQKIYENLVFNRFQSLSVEIIEDFFSEKVIHSLFVFGRFHKETRQSGGF